MQGFNMGRYYAPDASAAPTFNAPSARAKPGGAPTIRFELPFAVWCTHCDPAAIVGQGVRFNAEKRKVGAYYSTPIWGFRMKHTACGGWWEIRTDPKNAAYVVVEGARRRDYGEDNKAEGEGEGELRFLSEEERQKRREDAFAALEGKKEEQTAERGNKERLEELYGAAEVWRDPYDVNAKLRREFRGKRRGWKREERVKEGLQEKFSLGLEIADATEVDDVQAKLVEFGAGAEDKGVEEAVRMPLFTSVKAAMGEEGERKKRLKSEIVAEKSRQSLQHAVVGNTRATIDPFLSAEAKKSGKLCLGIKRKREDDAAKVPNARSPVAITPSRTDTQVPALTAALVDYDSD
jgi:coiled-coil domain-containing protein 130